MTYRPKLVIKAISSRQTLMIRKTPERRGEDFEMKLKISLNSFTNLLRVCETPEEPLDKLCLKHPQVVHQSSPVPPSLWLLIRKIF